ncbi:hypothetical protein CK203_093803 [Vitis vinifera]|uniref:Retrotransposon gag domain-containing protein n=1 Tax=Vitis vinifera TaxID=29760 RepID=A0A438C821_VITVI|nr:hypothetical protein CK203_093803 [Vitis vinifera]
MCGGDDHLARKRLVSSETCKELRTAGGTPSLHVGAYEVFQSLCGHSLDSTLPLFSLQLRVLRDRSQFRSWFSLKSPSWRRVGGRLIRSDSHQSSDSLVEMSDELASTLASIQEFMETKVERLESRMRQIRLQDGGLTWDDRDGIPVASLPAKFRMLDIECYSGIGYPKIHLRLYSTFMRAHEINDAQLMALFPMSFNEATQRWFASVEPLRLRTWEDMAHEFLTQFAFSADIDVFKRELEATRQRPNESISSFVNRWRAKVVGMIDRPKKRDQIDMVLRNLQPRFTRHLVGIPFQDLKSLVHSTFSVKEAIAQGLWTDTTPSPDTKGKKPIGSSSRSGEPYIAQTSIQPRPSHPRVAADLFPIGVSVDSCPLNGP